MKIKTLSLLCVFMALTGGLAARAAVSPADKTFVTKAAQGGLLEVELGKVAAAQGDSQEVKDFGSKMVEDHGKANDELKSIASSKGLTIGDSLDAKHQKILDELKAKSGKEFDKAYVSEMVKDHKMDNKEFMKEAKSGSDPDLKAFADKTDKVIQEHLQMITDIQSKMK